MIDLLIVWAGINFLKKSEAVLDFDVVVLTDLTVGAVFPGDFDDFLLEWLWRILFHEFGSQPVTFSFH